MKDNISRTFPEIWVSLDKRQKRAVYEQALIGIHCADITFRNWAAGRSVPKSYPTAKLICEILSQAAGINTTPEELFPKL